MSVLPPVAPTGPDALNAGNLLASWPAHLPLAMLAWHPAHRDSQTRTFAATPVWNRELKGPGSLRELKSILQTHRDASTTARTGTPEHGPGGRGFVVMLSYDLFRHLEPSSICPRGATDDRGWPDAILLRCEGGMFIDRDAVVIRGDPKVVPELKPRQLPRPRVGPIAADRGGDVYREAVADVVERIREGECFQVNLAQRFGARFRGSVRSVGAAALAQARPRHGAVLECGPGRALVSMSPELFLETSLTEDGTLVRTRPIKGTRPSSIDPEVLLKSEKDAAELAMIVDLMRNDLGRVCRIGSVRVVEGRRLETHETVHHGVAEISGILRPDLDLVDLLEASLPPGSITGAPKVRAMQVIDELEPVRRGPYCGAIGWIDDEGWSTLNVAIRTIACTGTPLACRDELDGRLDYLAGCGIVADSDPEAEYLESLDKTEVFRRTVDQLRG
ncbi:MAG: aminodeoxychorismate synthase component I [Phycisphaerae bacterium]|nr:aminodeoxychorismate synthase component I [Phycisphaerae bacterium]